MSGPDLEYDLDPKRIAQEPATPRDSARLMVLEGRTGRVNHLVFADLPTVLKAGDLLVANDTRVFPARLLGETGAGCKVEVLLLKQLAGKRWETLVRPGRRVPSGTLLEFQGDVAQGNGARTSLKGVAGRDLGDGKRELTFEQGSKFTQSLEALGRMPLPPYIKSSLAGPDRYQTIYARKTGSKAAPTAGLHFTKRVLNDLKQAGVDVVFLTLTIGLDTFRPIRGSLSEHRMHGEKFEISPGVARKVNQARAEERRIIAVGTSSARALEAAIGGVPGGARSEEAETRLKPGVWETDLFIRPGYRFQVVNGMITNFHLPRSTTLLLAAAFAGSESLMAAYEEAKEEGYRFYSFGDSMLIL